MHFLFSPFIVPVVACFIPIVAIGGGIWSQAYQRRLKAEQRMAMLARGIPLSEIEMVLGAQDRTDGVRPQHDPLRRMKNARTAAIVLMSVGTGLMLFFIVLSHVLQERDVLAGAAAGLIPFAIGVGFLIDYMLQRRDVLALGLTTRAD